MQAVISSPGTIQMVDLKSQYLRLKPAIDAAIQYCIDETAFIRGPQVSEFESKLADYLNVRHVISCANGTDALQIAMMALELQPGDEVILPAFTYIATAEVIALLGFTPVMVDVDPQTFTVDRSQIEAALSARTKLVVPVHLFGQCADMDGIRQICAAHNIAVVEDNAQALGASCRFSDGQSWSAGAMGQLGTTSFFPSKNLGCFGDGGAVYTNDDTLATRARMIANHGQQRKYHHDLVGINSRLDTLQAAILTEKLAHLNAFTQARQAVANRYDTAFANCPCIETPFRAAYSTHVFHQYTIKVPADCRDDLKTFLADRGIPTMVYYPLPLSQQRAYQHRGRVVGELPVTMDLCRRVLSLPMHTELPDAQLEYITETLLRYFA